MASAGFSPSVTKYGEFAQAPTNNRNSSMIEQELKAIEKIKNK
jgi:hypothetical protein|tara:strand:+ start:358 stop:486 length:129 start_codon:yes stop_codon:yes gene_type:complete